MDQSRAKCITGSDCLKAVYFMNRALKLGGLRLYKTGKSFLLGEDISLDFATIHSNFDLKGYEDNVVATTAFGQGETLVTPLQMAMVTQSIANDGVMLKPYLFKSVVNGKEIRTTVYTLDNIPLRRTMIRMLLQREDKIAENCNG